MKNLIFISTLSGLLYLISCGLNAQVNLGYPIADMDSDSMHFHQSGDSLQYSSFYDRFGNVIPLTSLTRNLENDPSIKVGNKSLKSLEQTAGHFVVHYYETNTGFMETGSTGAKRRLLLETALNDLSVLIATPPLDPCTGEPAKVHILVNEDISSMKSYQLGNATAVYNSTYGNNTVLDGEVWQVLTTGKGSQDNIYHGYININFNKNASNEPLFDFYTEIDPTNPSITINQYDLYSIIIHEAFHALGFNSLIGSDGQSRFTKINKSFFSRFDLALKVNGTNAINPDNILFPYWDLRSSLNSTSVSGTCFQTKAFPSNCNYLSSSQGVYSPPLYTQASSLSHFDPVCPDGNSTSHDYIMAPDLSKGIIRRTPDAEEVNMLAELGYKTTGTFGQTDAIASNYSTYQPIGQVIGGINDGDECFEKFKIQSCDGNQLVIPISSATQNDGVQGSIQAVRLIEGQGNVAYDGTNLTFTPTTNSTGRAIIQYTPIYGCTFGNLTEIIILVLPCNTQACFQAENQACETNCNGNMTTKTMVSSNKSYYLDGIDFSSPDVVIVPNWEPGNRSSVDYYPNNGQGASMGIWAKEQVVHHVNLRANQNYVFRISAWCGSGDITKEIRFSGILSNSPPFPSKSVNETYGCSQYEENYLNRKHLLWMPIQVISGVNLNSGSNELTFCYTPSQDMRSVVIYLDPSEKKQGYTTFSNFIIEPVNIPSIEDEIKPCANSIEKMLIDECHLSNVLNFEWKDSNGNIVGAGTKATISKPGNYTVVANCEKPTSTCYRDEFNIIENADFEISGSISHCKGSIELTINGDPNYNYIYQWSNGATSKNVTNLSPGTYSVLVSNGNCSVNKQFTISPIQPIISASDKTICQGESTSLMANVTNGVSEDFVYSWSTQGSTIVGNPITVSPTMTSSYSVKADLGNCHSNNVTVTVKIATPQISVQSASICPGESAQLQAIITNGVTGDITYSWLAQGASSPVMGNPIIVSPSITTNYEVKAKLGDCESNPFTVGVTVKPVPQVNVSSVSICPGQQIQLQAIITNGVTGSITYSWLPQGGQTPITGNPITVSPTENTSYIVTATLENCVSQPITATVNLKSVPQISVQSSTICIGQSTQLQAYVTNGAVGSITYQWFKEGSSTPIPGNPITVSPTATSNYIVTATLDGCDSEPFTTTVTVKPTPQISVQPVSICLGQSTQLQADVTNGVVGSITFTWQESGNSTLISGNPITVSPSSTTSYTTIAELDGCTSSPILTNVVVFQPPVIKTANGSTSKCIGSSIVLNCSSSDGVQWYRDNNKILIGGNNQTFTAVQTGTYKVVQVFPTGCSLTSNEIEITDVNCCTNLPENTFVIPSESSYSGGTFPLTATTPAFIEGTWYINGNTILRGNNIAFGETGAIIVADNVTLTIINGSGSLDQTHLYSCGNYLWKGISLTGANSKLVILGGADNKKKILIEDADIAITAQNGARLDINNADFNKDRKDILIKDYTGSGNYPAIIKSSIFRCNTSNVKISTDVSAGLPGASTEAGTTIYYQEYLKGSSNEITAIGIEVQNIITSEITTINDLSQNIDNSLDIGPDNTFTYIQKGIDVSQGNVRIFNSSFSNLTNGIYIKNGGKKSFSVDNCSFTSFTNTAITVNDKLNLDGSDQSDQQRAFLIRNNTINSSTATGILIDSDIKNPRAIYYPSIFGITNNKFTAINTGIDIQNSITLGIEVLDNEFRIRSTTSTIGYGVKRGNSRQDHFRGNLFEGTGTSTSIKQYGLYNASYRNFNNIYRKLHTAIQISFAYPRESCNTITNVRYGFEIPANTLANSWFTTKSIFETTPVGAHINIVGSTTFKEIELYTSKSYSYTVNPSVFGINRYPDPDPCYDLVHNEENLEVFESLELTDIQNNKPNEESLIQVFPNPSMGVFKIITLEDVHVQLFDAVGRFLNVLTLNSGSNEINLSSKENGIYFLKVTNKNGETVLQEKLIVVH